MEEKWYQKNVIQWLLKIDSEIMIPVYGKMLMGDSDVYIQSWLIPKERISEEMKQFSPKYSIDSFSPGFTKYGTDEIEYFRYGNDENYEPIISIISYEGLEDDCIELAEEFRQLYGLFYDVDHKSYRRPAYDDEEVCANKDGLITIKKNYLKSYLAIKDKALIIYIDSRVDSKETIEPYHNAKLLKEQGIYCELDIDSSSVGNYSLLTGRKVIEGCNIEDCGVWPYEGEKEYTEFTIGMDSDGKAIKYTCDPSKLSNFYTRIDGAPYYLTPVYFDKNVLAKYYNDPKHYTIESGILKCGSAWSLCLDTENKDYVSVYLGDLGRELPSLEEQNYWRGFNKLLDGKLSDAKIQTDFMTQFSESRSTEFKFNNHYRAFSEKFEEKFGWPLFLPLSKEDEYNFTVLRIPLQESQSEFDQMVLYLDKLIIDSLNVKEIRNLLTIQCQNQASITTLEEWLKEKNISDYSGQISFLRNLQELRSSGTGHRKGKGYEKISGVFNITGNNFKNIFEDILEYADGFLGFMEDNIDNLL